MELGQAMDLPRPVNIPDQLGRETVGTDPRAYDDYCYYCNDDINNNWKNDNKKNKE